MIKKKIYLTNIFKYYVSKIFNYKSIFRYNSKFGRVFLDEINGGVSKIIAFYGTREDDKQLLLKEAIYPNTLHLDIGSNIGVFPYFVCNNSINDDNFLVALEPDYRNQPTLFKNLENCKTRHIFLPFAVSNEDGEANFLITKEPNLNHLISDKSKLENKKLKNIVNVSTVTLKTLFHKYIPKKYFTNNYNLLLRMDIEGGEYKVLDSLKSLLSDNKISFRRISVVYENHPPGIRKDFYFKVLKDLLKIGFSFKCLISAGDLNIDDLSFLFSKETRYNYITSDNFVRIRINNPLKDETIKALTSKKKLIRYCVLEK